MSNFTGVVKKIFPQSAWGTRSFALDSDRTYYNLGKVPPTFSEGMTISFDGRAGKRPGNVDVDVNTIKVVTEQPVTNQDYSMANASERSPGARKNTVLQKDDYWNRKEERDIENSKRIEIQACRNTAVAYVSAAFKDLDPETFYDKVNEYTNLFLENNNDRLSA